MMTWWLNRRHAHVARAYKILYNNNNHTGKKRQMPVSPAHYTKYVTN